LSDGATAAGRNDARGSETPVSRVGDVQVHVVDLTRIQPRPEHLGEREKARLQRLRIAAKRDQFAAAQTALRELLGRRLDRDPAHIEFVYGDHGKPRLADRPELGFNLTHSRGLALVALASVPDVGIDVEFLGRRRPFGRLSRRYFAEAEHRWLARQPTRHVGRGFYRLWVLKEAYLKAVGTGLTFPPSGFVLRLEQPSPRLESTRLAGDAPGNWSFRELQVDPQYAAALCIRGRVGRIRVLDFAGAATAATSDTGPMGDAS